MVCLKFNLNGFFRHSMTTNTYLGCNRLSGTVLGRSVFLDELDIGLADICETGRDVFDAGLDLVFDILEAGREFDFLRPNGSSAPIFSMRLRYFFSPSFNSLKLRILVYH